MVEQLLHQGQPLGHYRLVHFLGQRGFAEVYLGEHIHLHTHAAVKVLQTRLANEDVLGIWQGFLPETAIRTAQAVTTSFMR